MNNINLIGRIVNELELKYTANGKAVLRFTIAVDKGYSKERKLEEQVKNNPTADFIPIQAWDRLAEIIAEYSGKGKQIGISGTINSNNYEKEGKKIYTLIITANNIDLLGGKDNIEKVEEIEASE